MQLNIFGLDTQYLARRKGMFAQINRKTSIYTFHEEKFEQFWNVVGGKFGL